MKAVSPQTEALWRVLLLAFFITACSEENLPYQSVVRYEALKVLGANRVGAGSASVCRGTEAEPVGLRLNVVLRGTLPQPPTADRDRSIRPGTILQPGSRERHAVEPERVTPDLFELTIQCVEPYPDEDLLACPVGSGQSTTIPVKAVDWFDYHHEEGTRNARVAVAVLFDMSGSMTGRMAPGPHYNEESLEDSGKITGIDTAAATDFWNARYGALASFIKSLNDDDIVVLFAYNEEGVELVCTAPGRPDTRESVNSSGCWSTDKGLLTGVPPGAQKSALDSLKGTERGRTPLWLAVDTAYNYLAQHPATAGFSGFKHILVLGDGPDTCAESADLSQCFAPCAQSLPFEQVREAVTAQDPDDRIPIHFLQIAARGYPEIDPRQQEMACLTGGHYRFVNTFDIPTDSFEAVLRQSLLEMRYALRGYWRLTVDLPAVRPNSEPPPGHEYSVLGFGSVYSGAHRVLITTEDLFPFMVDSSDIPATDYADRRLTFRKECNPGDASACPANAPLKECTSTHWWCDEQTLTCRHGEAWAPNGSDNGCPPADGYIVTEVRRTVGEETVTEFRLEALPDLSTRCCRGRCMPPAPPEVPENVAHPAGMPAACFWYEDARGWRKEHPGIYTATVPCETADDCSNDLTCADGVCTPDLSDESEFAWIYRATLNENEGCAYEDFVPYLSTSPPPTPSAWDYCADEENCFPPPKP